MTSDALKVAKAWQAAAIDLHIEVIAPWTFIDNEGQAYPCVAYLRSFGSPRGIMIGLLDDDDQNDVRMVQQEYAYSKLHPDSYGQYDRDFFIDTLNDWGWFGKQQDAPSWYSGNAWE